MRLDRGNFRFLEFIQRKGKETGERRGERNYKDIREIYGREEKRGQRRMEAWST